MNKFKYIGMDVHQSSISIAILDAAGKLVTEATVKTETAAIVDFFEHALALPLAFHDEHHTGRLLRTLHAGSGNLFETGPLAVEAWLRYVQFLIRDRLED